MVPFQLISGIICQKYYVMKRMSIRIYYRNYMVAVIYYVRYRINTEVLE